MRTAVALVACMWFGFAANATHLIGGELFYTSLGNDEYEVTLKMYRDCDPANNVNGTGFDADVQIAAYDESGQFVTSQFFTLSSSTFIPIVLNNPCQTPPEGTCVEEGSYTGTFFLPAGAGAYTLSYQRCCRPPMVTNLDNSPLQGLTCTVEIPDASVTGENSSPRFSAFPPISLCIGQPLAFSSGATDPEGDQLEYDFFAPYVGGDDLGNIIPNPPAPPPFTSVVWATGYSVNNMIDAAPPLEIDPLTGFVTLTPTLQGFFTVGVRVKEFRNGVQLSEVVRDFRFDVVPCVQTVLSSIADQGASTLCSGLTIQFENNSQNSTSYHWDFGVPGTNTDTSAEAEPSFTFPEAGTYNVTLIANPGWICADTNVSSFSLSPPVTVSFVSPPITCFDEQPITLSAVGSFTNAASVVWDLGTGSAADVDQHVTHPSFPTNGTHSVHVTATENGCTDDFTGDVIIYPRPVPLFSADTAGCIPLLTQFTNSSSAWTAMSNSWDFGDGGSSTDVQPIHTYTTEGFHTVSLTISTDSGCIASETLVLQNLVQVWPQPIASFVVNPPVADLLHPIVHVQDISSSAYHWDFTVEGQHYDTTSFDHNFNDAGWYTITLVAVSGLGCMDSTSRPVFVGDHFFFAPTAFTPDGDGLNEVWLPRVKGARKYQLDVFDRWGQSVFSTTDPDQGWDAKDYPIGLYSYKAWISEWGPLEKEYNGSIMLVR
ncbi:MAG: PKD domain-containing protein [Flavobacteriales bacterium]|nr:PKD domain-containing protein [Flavobacteriales bacterium]